jgi:hypothetical protein
MQRIPGVPRARLAWLALVSLLIGCQSPPPSDVVISPESSLLAVDVLFPAPLSRDPSLVQVYFVKGSIHAGMPELPEFIPASFVKWDRAYLIDPEPGTYSVVAVTAAYGPPLNDYRIADVSKTTWSRTSSDAMVFPADLIQKTRTPIAPGRVAYMGVLRVRRGNRIGAETQFQDDLQRKVAEHLRPGVTSESGFAGWLKRTRMVDLDATSLSNDIDDRETFLDVAMADLDGSPWVRVIAGAAPTETVAVRTTTAQAASPKNLAPIPELESAVPQTTALVAEAPSPEPQPVAPEPEPGVDVASAEPQSAAPEPEVIRVEQQATTPEPAVAVQPLLIPIPEVSPDPPERRRFSNVPPGSLLAEIEFGMSHRDVRGLAGDPDGRIDRLTAKAWIPFYNGPGANLRDWVYEGNGRVVFSLYDGSLRVIDVVYDPGAKK